MTGKLQKFFNNRNKPCIVSAHSQGEIAFFGLIWWGTTCSTSPITALAYVVVIGVCSCKSVIWAFFGGLAIIGQQNLAIHNSLVKTFFPKPWVWEPPTTTIFQKQN